MSKPEEIPAAELTRQIQDMLTRFGFTSVFDLGSTASNTRVLRDRIETGEVDGPRIRFTRDGIARVNPRVPPESVLGLMGVMKPGIYEVADATQAASTAKTICDDGVDGIKLFASTQSGSTLPDGVIEAAANEARLRRCPSGNTMRDTIAFLLRIQR